MLHQLGYHWFHFFILRLNFCIDNISFVLYIYIITKLFFAINKYLITQYFYIYAHKIFTY